MTHAIHDSQRISVHPFSRRLADGCTKVARKVSEITRRVFVAIGNFFQTCFQTIQNTFYRLFKRKQTSTPANIQKVASIPDGRTITLSFPEKPPISINYNPNEKMWEFCNRLGSANKSLMKNKGDTIACAIKYNDKIVNTYDLRLETVGKLIPDPQLGLKITYLTWGPRDVNRVIFQGNASSKGSGDRSMCPICLEEFDLHSLDLEQIATLERMATVTKCGHVFHQGCLVRTYIAQDKNPMDCPTCRGPLHVSPG